MNNELSKMVTTQERITLVWDNCTRVYGNSTDGSFEACLIAGNYYVMKKRLNDDLLLAQDVSSGQEINQTFSQSF